MIPAISDSRRGHNTIVLHLPMSETVLGNHAALSEGLQSPVTKEKMTGKRVRQCINYLGISGQTNPATVAVPGDELRPVTAPVAFTYPLFVNAR